MISIEDYQRTRQQRFKRRQFFIIKLKQVSSQASPASSSISAPPIKMQNEGEEDLQELMMENNQLKTQIKGYLAAWQNNQSEQAQKMQEFSQKIQKVKTLYLNKIKEISQQAKTRKENDEQKISKIQSQIENGLKRSEGLEKENKSMREQVEHFNQLMGKYTTQIRNEYSAKMEDFNKIYEASNQKLREMEKDDSKDEFINSVLNDGELLDNITANSQASSSEEMDSMIKDYQELLDAKDEILIQMKSNNELKQKQISRMTEIEEKMKTILDKLKNEKDLYLQENKQMHCELMEVKDLLIKTMGGAIGE